MVLGIVGKTASGKTTLVDQLVKEYGYSKVVTYTTRPMRNGEVDGRDYHFVSDEDFSKMKENGEFLETTSYNTKFGRWSYGSKPEDYEGLDKVVILNPDGLKALKNSSVKCFVVYLSAKDETIRYRLDKRGDAKEEAERRIAADNEDFKCIESLCDVTLPVEAYTNLKSTVDHIYSEAVIKEFDEENLKKLA